MQKKNNRKLISMSGFTLIELLMGILIMGILTLLALPVISTLQQNNEISKNNYGYNVEQKLLTIPFYFVPFIAKDLAEGNMTLK